MNPILRIARKRTTPTRPGTPQVTPPHSTKASTLLEALIAGVILGVVAQILRQIPGACMYLGASTGPWVMVGFLFAFSSSRGTRTLRKAILIATGTVSVYLLAWLISYHLLFVLRESVSAVDGWRQAAPWLVAAVPVSLILGTIAALSHRRGLLGDACLAAPIALSLAEPLYILREGWLGAAAVGVPIIVLATLLVHMVGRQRRLRPVTMIVTFVMLGALGVALFPLFLFLMLGRF